LKAINESVLFIRGFLGENLINEHCVCFNVVGMDGAEKEFTTAYGKLLLYSFLMVFIIIGVVFFGFGILGRFLGAASFYLIPILVVAIVLGFYYFFFVKSGIYAKMFKSSVKMFQDTALGDQNKYYKEYLKGQLREELKEELRREMLEEMKKKELHEESKKELGKKVSQEAGWQE